MEKPIASCSITNVASMNIYDIIYEIDDKVLAGINSEKPQWYDIQSEISDDECDEIRNYFMYGEIKYYIDEFIKL